MLQAHYYENTAAHFSERSLEKPEAFAQTCSDEELSQEWLGFLEFDGQCNHTYISEREAVNRWYALARAGLSVAAAHDRLSQLMRDSMDFADFEQPRKAAISSRRLPNRPSKAWQPSNRHSRKSYGSKSSSLEFIPCI